MLETAARRLGFVLRRLRGWLVAAVPLGPGIDDRGLLRRLETLERSRPTGRGAPLAAHRAISGVLRAVGLDEMRARAWERAIRSDPSEPERWLGLARALQTTGAPGPVMNSGLGLSLGATASTESAAYAYDRAIDLGPLADALNGAAEAARAREELDLAVDLAARSTGLFPHDGSSWVTQARCLATHGQRAGGLTPVEVDAVTKAWQRALDLGGPTGPRARFHLLRHSIRFADWERAFTVADPLTDVAPGDPAEIAALSNDERFVPSADWWYAAWWRLQAARRSLDGWTARRREAETRLSASGSAIAPIDQVQLSVQCLTVLGRENEALSLLTRARRFPDAAGRLRRLRADTILRTGDPSALVDWTAAHRTGLPTEPEGAFSDLVRGQRVAVLGPHASLDDRRRASESHQVVIDTKQLASYGATTLAANVSYYADTSSALFVDSILDQLDAGSLDLAVLRPTALGDALSRHQRVRIMPSEDSLSLGVSHFAIARIVYDVLRYEPRSVTLVGVDLFTSTTEYPESYRVDDHRYRHSGLARVLPRFNHDVGDDFALLSTLYRSGVIDADGDTASRLVLGFDDYLAAVDAAARIASREAS